MMASTMSNSHQEASLADQLVLQIGLVVHLTTTRRGLRQHDVENPTKQEHQPDRIYALHRIQHQQHILEAKHCPRPFKSAESLLSRRYINSTGCCSCRCKGSLGSWEVSQRRVEFALQQNYVHKPELIIQSAKQVQKLCPYENQG